MKKVEVVAPLFISKNNFFGVITYNYLVIFDLIF